MLARGFRSVVAWVLISVAVVPVALTARTVLAVYVVAPSQSTHAEAEEILKGGGWRRVAAAEASNVLVVVRSGLVFPLSPNYDTLEQLEEDAGRQPNGNGPRFHVYVFGPESETALKQLKHLSYDVE